MRRRFHFISYIMFAALTWLGFISFPLPSAAQEISVANTSLYVGNGRWDWTVFIQASPQVLKEIACVEYELHPSYPKPVRKVCRLGDQRHPFGHTTNGWGEFEIKIKVMFKSGDVRSLRHRLSLATPPVGEALPIRVDNEAEKVGEGLWKWTVFIEGPSNALDQIQCVEYTLHPTFPNPVREVCDRGIGPHAFALTAKGWGTFQLYIRVFLRDGRVQELTHNLIF